MDDFFDILLSIWDVTLEAAPWLLFGLLAAGIIKAWVPQRWIARAMGGQGPGAVLRAAVVGIPLPLCSCGVLPTAISLRRQGASRSATSAFLISTPEIGLDSIALSYALLGPFMAIARPIASFISALVAGLMVAAVEPFARPSPPSGQIAPKGPQGPSANAAGHACCGEAREADPTDRCCASATSAEGGGVWRRLADGLRYVMTTLLDDIKLWLAVAVVVAGVVYAFAGDNPGQMLEAWGSGPLAKGMMLVVGIPLYVCATASTPIAAGLLVAGVSPGTVLVLLLAGPATNIGSIAVLKRELGTPVVAAYLAGVVVASLACGIATDLVAGYYHITISDQLEHVHHLIPRPLAFASAIILIAFAIPPLRRLILRPFNGAEARGAASGCSKP